MAFTFVALCLLGALSLGHAVQNCEIVVKTSICTGENHSSCFDLSGCADWEHKYYQAVNTPQFALVVLLSTLPQNVRSGVRDQRVADFESLYNLVLDDTAVADAKAKNRSHNHTHTHTHTHTQTRITPAPTPTVAVGKVRRADGASTARASASGSTSCSAANTCKQSGYCTAQFGEEQSYWLYNADCFIPNKGGYCLRGSCVYDQYCYSENSCGGIVPPP